MNKNHLKITLSTQNREKFKKDYPLDEKTKENLKKIYSEAIVPDLCSIGSLLPSSGVVFRKGFVDALLGRDKSKYTFDYNSIIELNNFYDPYKTLLHTRKISQLIAKTWHCRLEADKKTTDDTEKTTKIHEKTTGTGETYWEKFARGSWDGIPSEILDGLIARDLFLYGNSSEPTMDPDPEKGIKEMEEYLKIYYPLTSKPEPRKKDARFLILPSSKNWQSITLSLLLAGQAYYRVDEKGAYKKDGISYHQVSQSILSTGEIVTKYALDVAYSNFKGDIKELDLAENKASAAYLAILPYPPIPSEIDLPREDIKTWAYADDAEPPFPFYSRSEDGEYLIGTNYHTSPYAYIPLSCS